MGVKKSNISFAETKQFSKLFLDYLGGEKSLQQFYAYPPEIESFELAIKEKAKENINRGILVEVLYFQYSKLENVKLDKQIISTLKNKNTYTVCTGHQLCLFTGPLYFIYKIITTINLAEKLKKKYPDCDFVPIYWMASEDHDFEEISSINLFGKKINWNYSNTSGAVGRMETSSLNIVIEELKQIVGESSQAKELIQLFHDTYIKHNNLAIATRYLVDQLFGKYGLVVIDGDEEPLKREFAALIKDDILNNTNHQLVNNTILELEKLGYQAQVSPREINCFYLKDTIRERIELDLTYSSNEGGASGGYKVLNTDIKFSKEELISEIELHPEHFSPNVVLRPLYQQYILPNIAYVAGPGEIAYWLEYKAMFNHHQINYPVLIPRNFAMLSDEKINQQIEKFSLEQSDFFNDSELIIKKFISKNTEGMSLQEEEERLNVIFNAVEAKAILIDKTLKGSVEAEKQKILNSLKNIESKIIKAEKQKHEISINQIKKIKEKFMPNGVLQERYDNISSYYLKSGSKIIDELKNAFDPFEREMLLLTID